MGVDDKSKFSVDERQQVIEKRNKQTIFDRTSEYVLGISLDDPRLYERVEEDRKIVIQKYGLPSYELLRNDPSEYEKRLREVIRQNGYQIRSTEEREAYFKDTPDSRSAPGPLTSHELKSIFVDIDRSDEKSYRASLRNLRHETVHVACRNKYPSIPIEAEEYEATILDLNMDFFRNHPDGLRINLESRWIYNFLCYYRKQNDGKDPEWNSPEWFLKNVDKVM